MKLNFFWFLPTSGDTRYFGKPGYGRKPTIGYMKQVALAAESAGFDGVLIPTGSGCLDPWITAATLAPVTSTLKLLVALRPSTAHPSVIARQASTLDQALEGRLLLNIVPGGYAAELAAEGVSISHDERYALADEFLSVWKGLFNDETVSYKGKYIHSEKSRLFYTTHNKKSPPLFFGGSSPVAHDLAARQIDTYISWGEPPLLVKEKIQDVKNRAEYHGREVKFGLRIHVIVRETAQEAWEAAKKLIENLDDETIARAQKNLSEQDSVGQQRLLNLHQGNKDSLVLSPDLWAGIGLVRGGAGTALVGDAETVAKRIREYADLGIDTFVLSGYPHLEESLRFAELVLPLLSDKPELLSEERLFTGGAFDSRS
ncbi:FMNH2-dependent alkanesulfonate monooxygenase [Serratia sp. CY85251]|uniref:FMNH2-dependent alkanesulfonate monooxygenase n=1 Tax=Serratia sp. CY85251 TaxID=3383696 RepID=UPI003F9FA130